MAQDTSIEAARARIQRLVEEISALSRKEMRSEEYFAEYLKRVVQATDARGGAVWLVAQRPGDGKSEFQLAAQVEFESSLFHNNEGQHQFLLRQLTDTAQGKKVVVAPPEPPAPDPGSLEAQMAAMHGAPAVPGGNRTPFPFFHLPLTLKDQVLGVLQVWLQPYVTQQNYGEFVTFLGTLAGHVEQHFHSRRLGNLVLENQRLQQILKFASDLAGSLDPLEVARLSANYGRDLIGCERCSVLTRRGERWTVVAISGQETVEKKSAMVKAMAAFVDAHAKPEALLRRETDPATGTETMRPQVLVLSKKAVLALVNGSTPPSGDGTSAPAAPPAAAGEAQLVNAPQAEPLLPSDRADIAYFEHSLVVSAAMAPMFDAEQELVGVFFAESTTEGFFEAPGGGAQRLTEWLATHSGKALQAAEDYKTLPLRTVSTTIRTTYRKATGNRRKRFFFWGGILTAIILGIALYPKMRQIDGGCEVKPTVRAVVVPEVGGRVEKILAREGTAVKKGQTIAQLGTRRLEAELEATRQEYNRAAAEADRLRGMGDEGAAKVAALNAEIFQKNSQRLEIDIAAATLRSPIDGVVLTKDLELHAGEFIQPGTPFAEIASLENWELHVDVNERRIGEVEKELLERKRALPVHFILYSHSAHKLSSKLEAMRQISAMAYPRESENVFIVTLPNIEAPPEVRADFRPGLTGRAKIDLYREPVAVWIWRAIMDRLRLMFLH